MPSPCHSAKSLFCDADLSVHLILVHGFLWSNNTRHNHIHNHIRILTHTNFRIRIGMRIRICVCIHAHLHSHVLFVFISIFSLGVVFVFVFIFMSAFTFAFLCAWMFLLPSRMQCHINLQIHACSYRHMRSYFGSSSLSSARSYPLTLWHWAIRPSPRLNPETYQQVVICSVTYTLFCRQIKERYAIDG